MTTYWIKEKPKLANEPEATYRLSIWSHGKAAESPAVVKQRNLKCFMHDVLCDLSRLMSSDLNRTCLFH